MCVLGIYHCRNISSVILLILYVYNNVMDLAKGFVQGLVMYFLWASYTLAMNCFCFTFILTV